MIGAAIVAIHRCGFKDGSAVVGEMETGYMVVPLSGKPRAELETRAVGRGPMMVLGSGDRERDFRKVLT